MIFLRSSLNKDEQRGMGVFFGIILLGGIIVIKLSSALDPADGGPGRDIINEAVENEVNQCCTCSRELSRVLMGGGTTLASLLVSLGGWYHCDFHKDKKQICGHPYSPFRVFITIVAGSLVPQIFMSFVLSSALAAVVLQQRIADNGSTEDKGKKRLAKWICTLVVWIRIDNSTYKSLVRNSQSLSALFGTDHKKSGSAKGEEPEPGIEDALFFKEGKSLRALPAHHHTIPSTAGVNPHTPTDTQPYYLCSQSWDADNLLWKEALLQTKGVLPEVDELQMIQSRTLWESIIVAVQTLGYLVSFLSRFVYGRGARVSVVEVMSAWISIALVVQLLVVPTQVTYCNRGICLDLSERKLRDVVKYYEQKRERKDKLLWPTMWVLVLCLIFLFALVLVLIPPLVYYYYRLSSSVLTFAALLPFTVLSGIAIMAFLLTLIFPPHDVVFAFVAYPFLTRPRSPKSSKYMTVVSTAVLLVGFTSYALAIIDTSLNWHLFHARDCYFSTFVIPHIGS